MSDYKKMYAELDKLSNEALRARHSNYYGADIWDTSRDSLIQALIGPCLSEEPVGFYVGEIIDHPELESRLKFAVIFDNLMRNLWGDDDPPQGFMVKAMADKLRGNARVNHENALDVLDVLGPDVIASVHVRGSDVESEPHVAIFTVKFFDGSSVLIEAPRGIGSGVEVL